MTTPVDAGARLPDADDGRGAEAIAAPAPSRTLSDDARRRVQLRTVVLLCLAQVLGGLAMGASLALGAILGERLSGAESLAGLPTTVLTLGAAAAGLPLAALAQRSGRRPALATGFLIAAAGACVVAVAVDTGWFALLLVGMAGVGSGTAVSLQSRFAATDLATPRTRGRDLSLVVWMTMVGAVAGPALLPIGADVADIAHIDELAGPFVIGAAGSAAAALVLLLGLRPDPLRFSADGAPTAMAAKPSLLQGFDTIRQTPGSRNAVASVVSAHAVMVAVMALTPVHMTHGGASLTVVGLSISAHVAGMYALAPVMGLLTDRLGRVPTVLVGQALLLASCIAGFVLHHSQTGLVVALVLLGLGWSAATVAGSTMLTDSVAVAMRPRVQGITDTSMSLAGAIAGALAGVVVGLFGYPVLVLAAGAVSIAAAVYLVVDRPG
ncbi:MFS transporter [Gordonia sp. OPL2]|uniref:MFS transporter n=1 Tax=Gordonia sp. OPL2 TaxID=2486274 RepID=UPI0016551FAA|nr:MFS transporter [Gordonia sp. OPL2]ROZ98013.1 MFS transporter [Gordonia sp. OPL2]